MKSSLSPDLPSQDGASLKRGPLTRGRISAARIDFSAIERLPEATEANKNQQLTAARFLAEATKINRNQHNSTESAKVSKISPGPRAQSAKISNSQQ